MMKVDENGSGKRNKHFLFSVSCFQNNINCAYVLSIALKQLIDVIKINSGEEKLKNIGKCGIL